MPRNPYERFRDAELILRDELAMDRTVLANERTYLAYVRTGLAFGVTGAGSIQLFPNAAGISVGWGLVALGLFIAVTGTRRYRATARLLSTCREPMLEQAISDAAEAKSASESSPP